MKTTQLRTRQWMRCVLCGLLAGLMMAGPFVGCSGPAQVPVATTNTSTTANKVADSVAQKGNTQSETLATTDHVQTAKSDQHVATPTVSIDMTAARGLALSQQDAKALYLKLKAQAGTPLPRSLDDSAGPNTTTIGDCQFTLTSDYDLTPVEQATYQAATSDIAADPNFSQDALSNQIDQGLATDGLAQTISAALANVQVPDSSTSGSRDVGDDTPPADLVQSVQSAVQSAVDQYSQTQATQTLAIAADQETDGTGDISALLNDPSSHPDLTDAENQAAAAAASDSSDASRSLSSSATVAGNRPDFLNWLNTNATSSMTPADVLYVYGPGLGDVITGHCAIWDSHQQEWLTADDPAGQGSKANASTGLRTHAQEMLSGITAAKLLTVSSSKTADQRSAAVEAAYHKYNGRPYQIVLRKQDDSKYLYCSQVCWLTWNNWLGVDIDGTWWPTSFTLNQFASTWIPVTIHLGWWTITISILVVYLIVVIFTQDIVYPWDIVISGNTREYLRTAAGSPAG